MTDLADRLAGDRSESGSACGSLGSCRQTYSQLEALPPLPALRSLTKLGSDLLQRTAELPDTEQGLLSVLAEYRYAVFTFVAVAARV